MRAVPIVSGHILTSLTMPLAAGSRLGPYEIVELIGAGGMGEVYRARDTAPGPRRRDQDPPATFAQDADRLARFQREATTLAALNHPNIAQVFGLEQANGVRALVMELVAGHDLSELIARGPMQVADALLIAKQITDALEAAHEQGIVHRDLKPGQREDSRRRHRQGARLRTRQSGGPGRQLERRCDAFCDAHVSRHDAGRHDSGTAVYMSPEQARGRAVDKRADIWAFGCVLYEMVAARRAFAGEDITETLASVVKDPPILAQRLQPCGT